MMIVLAWQAEYLGLRGTPMGRRDERGNVLPASKGYCAQARCPAPRGTIEARREEIYLGELEKAGFDVERRSSTYYVATRRHVNDRGTVIVEHTVRIWFDMSPAAPFAVRTALVPAAGPRIPLPSWRFQEVSHE